MLKHWKCKVFVLIGGLLVFTSQTRAQCDTLPIRLPNNISASSMETEWIYNKLLDSLIYIIRSEYVLIPKDALQKDQYGQDGNPYFGRKWGVGVQITNVLFFGTSLQLPWKYDESLKQYADTLMPKLSSLGFYPVYSTTYTRIALKENKSTNPKISHILLPHNFQNQLQRGNAPPLGKLLLIYQTKANASEPNFSKIICKIVPKWVDNESNLSQGEIKKENLIGGILFYENFVAGSLIINIGGILIQSGKSDWKINKITR